MEERCRWLSEVKSIEKIGRYRFVVMEAVDETGEMEGGKGKERERELGCSLEIEDRARLVVCCYTALISRLNGPSSPACK